MRYTVKQASSLTGITPDRLRAWERRYGIVTPTRTESRYRLYDDADLARLRLMVRLVDAGTPASLAAEEVRAAYADLRTQVDRPSHGPTIWEPAAASSRTSAALSVEALVQPARSLSRTEVEQFLDRAFAADSFEAVVERWLLPALNAVGEAWQDGTVDIAGEHFVSSAVRRRLGRAFDAAGIARGGPVVLVGLPPAALHELGSLAFATCLRRIGVDVRWMGSDLPGDSWAHAVRQIRPAAVVISIPTEQDVVAALTVARRLGVSGPPTVFLGGRGAASVPVETETRTQVALLPFSVVEAAQTVAASVRAAA